MHSTSDSGGARLLDVNVLVALGWPNHVHHRPAREWFERISAQGWATTPVTELGFVRVSSNNRVIPGAAAPREAMRVLEALCEIGSHEFWPDTSRLLRPPFDLTGLSTSRQLTDVHLVALAVARGGALATFDRGVSNAVGPAGSVHVELIPADPAP